MGYFSIHTHPSGVESCQSEPSLRGADEAEGKRKGTPTEAPLTQSLTLIINYGCFCFILPRAVTGSWGQKERRKGNFHQTELPIKTSEMNVPGTRSGPPGRSVER